MAYRAETTVNWCPALGTVLANDEVKDGKSERGGYPVFQKKMMQWSMRITAYSDRLLKGLEGLDWSEAVKESQRNWIGKSEGASVRFKVQGTEEYIEVFTTRPDTIFGVSFITLAPEHQLVKFITSPEQKQAVEEYIEATSKRSERERMADVKNISGVFTGAYAEHPITQEPIPIWLGDYVLAGYGTGAVMAVPCGDDRDYAFAQHFNISIKNIFDKDLSDGAYTYKEGMTYQNSDFLNGETDFNKATDTVLKYLESHNAGKRQTNYRQRDAIFSRQRYWGEPVPVYYEDGVPYTLPVSALPLELPEVEKYLPTEDGDPPLGNAKAWYWDEINQCVVPAPQDPSKAGDRVFPLELSTMPGWAGSSWYFLRYMDAHNEDSFCDKAISDYWGQVDLYIGGSEHATGHLLYSRFWTMFLYDRGFISHSEPFQKMINQGMILGMSAFVYRIEGTNQFVSKGFSKDYSTQRIPIDISLLKGTSDELDIEKFKQWRKEFNDAEFILEDGKYITEREVEKMSKSKYNVVNPDDICEEYGADCLRLYEMFLGPLEQSKPWNTQGLSGVYGFLKKFYNLYFDGDAFSVSDEAPTKPELKVLHTLIKKVVYDIEHFSFNTSVSQFMIAVNELQKMKCNKREILEPLAVLISPYAPHLCEELWSLLGHSESVDFVPFPVLNESYLVEDEIEYPVSFNGKMRFKLPFSAALSKEEIEALVVKDERVIQQLNGNQPKKIIVVPKKIINIVV